MQNDDEDEKSISDLSDDDSKTPHDEPNHDDEKNSPLLRATLAKSDTKDKPEPEDGTNPLASSRPDVNPSSQKLKHEEKMLFLGNLGLRNSRIKQNRGEIIVFNKLKNMDINHIQRHVAGLQAQKNMLKKIKAEKNPELREQMITTYIQAMGLKDEKDRYKRKAFIEGELATLDERPNSDWKLVEDKKDKNHATITSGTLSIDIRCMPNEIFGAMVISSTAKTSKDFNLDMANGIKFLQENLANIEHVVVSGSSPEHLVRTINMLEAAGIPYKLTPQASKVVSESQHAHGHNKNSEFLNKNDLSLAAQTVTVIESQPDPEVQMVLKEFLMHPDKTDKEWDAWQIEKGIKLTTEAPNPSQGVVPENAIASTPQNTKSPAAKLLEAFKNPSLSMRAHVFADTVFHDDEKKSKRLTKSITNSPLKFARIAEMEYRTQHGSEPDLTPKNNTNGPRPM